MEQKPRPQSVPPHLQSLLDGLRRRIRLYVWLQGIAVALVWISLTFWFTYLIDYWLLVRGFAIEFPWQGRAVLLVITGAVLGFILYRWILRRAFVRMADRSMAILLERQFKDFHDSLVTSVEMAEQPDHASAFSQDMLNHTGEDALNEVSRIRLGEVFNFVPLAVSGLTAILLLLSVGGFCFLSARAAEAGESSHFAKAVDRIYFLDTKPWDRLAKIEIVGVTVLETPEVGAELIPTVLEPDENGVIRVARGSKVILHVRADAGMVIPEKCELTYTYSDGTESDPVILVPTGTIREERNKSGKLVSYKYFTLDEPPFDGPLDNFDFEVVGTQEGAIADWPISNRVEGTIEVVSSPIVARTELKYTLPKYMEDSQTAKSAEYRSGSKLPVGSSVTVHCQSNRPLRFAHISYPATEKSEARVETIKIPIAQKDRRQFQFHIPKLDDNLNVEITLHDTDDLTSDSPYRLMISALPDEPPSVNARFHGIGTAITPDVIIPFVGVITDKYKVARSWIEVQVTDDKSFQHDFSLTDAGEIQTAIDFQAKRKDLNDKVELVAGENRRIVVVVKAADECNLNASGNVGTGDIYELDVVTPDRLLVLLEKLEADQRSRLEDIYHEMQEALKFQLQVRIQGSLDSGAGAEPEDALRAGDEPGESEVDNVEEIRLIFAQRATVQSHKSSQELSGVIATIRDIRLQMINNRLDADAHKERLKTQIANPLHKVVDQRFPALKDALLTLEAKLQDLAKSPENKSAALDVELAVDDSIRQTEELLLELGTILESLRTIENYNMLLTKVRELYRAQLELKQRTEKEAKKQSIEDLID